MRSVLVLLVALAAASPAQDGIAALDSGLRLRLFAPLAGPRNSYFYSGLGVPLLRAAQAPPEGTLSLRLRTSQTHSADTRSADGFTSRIDGVYIEWARLDVEVALHDRVALWADVRIAGWDEQRDVFRIRDETGALVIQGEARKAAQGFATSRHENLAVVSFGGLVELLRGDDGVSGLAASLAIKLPGFRRADLTNSGTTDVALTLHGSLLLAERVALHANAGVIEPLGQPWVFQDSDAFNVHTFFQCSLGATVAVTDWLSLGASLEAETSPWEEDLAFLHRPALTIAGGARLRVGRFTIEAGVGAGVSSGSADWLAWLELGWGSEPLWSGP